MTEQEFIQLQNFLSSELVKHGCDGTNTLQHTYAMIHNIDKDELFAFTQANGGYCDCEVLMNVTPRVQDGTAEGLIKV